MERRLDYYKSRRFNYPRYNRRIFFRPPPFFFLIINIVIAQIIDIRYLFPRFLRANNIMQNYKYVVFNFFNYIDLFFFVVIVSPVIFIFVFIIFIIIVTVATAVFVFVFIFAFIFATRPARIVFVFSFSVLARSTVSIIFFNFFSVCPARPRYYSSKIFLFFFSNRYVGVLFFLLCVRTKNVAICYYGRACFIIFLRFIYNYNN